MSNRVNLVAALGITYKEDIISNLIVSLLNHSRGFQEKFLNQFMNIEKPEESTVQVYTRIKTSIGIPDIVAVINNREECYLLIIENKLKAAEGINQTLRYASNECLEDLKAGLNLSNKMVNEKLLFLTLIPESIPASPSFINICYEELIQCIPVEVIEDPGLKMVYEDFSNVLSAFYRGLDLHDDDLILEKFTEKTEPERLKIRFRKLIDGLSHYPNGLSRCPIGEVIGTGRIQYIVKISKQSWKGQESKKDHMGKYILEENTFDIHVECTFDAFHQSFTLPLHYETSPYLTKKQMANESAGSKKYHTQREQVKRIVHGKIIQLNDSSIRCYNGSNQIANTRITLHEKTTVKEFKEQLIANLQKISEIVDSALVEIDVHPSMNNESAFENQAPR